MDEFRERFLPLGNRLLRFAGYFMKEREDARDVVQDVLLKLWQRRDQLSTIGNPEAFSLQMVRNRCLDMLRGSRVVPLDRETEMKMREQPGPGRDPLETGDTVGMVKRLITKLPEQQRSAILLRDIEQLEFEEIAEITGMNVNTVRVNLSRARKQVRDELIRIWEYENKRSENITAEIF